MSKTNDYFVTRIDPIRIKVAKFADGEFLQVYVIEHSKCSCPGSTYHKTQCKHAKLKDIWIAQGEPLGLYYSIDNKGNITQHKYEGLECDT